MPQKVRVRPSASLHSQSKLAVSPSYIRGSMFRVAEPAPSLRKVQMPPS